MAMVLLSPQTSCQNELGEIGGPGGEETRLRSSSSVLTADLDTYCQPFLSTWEMVKRLSEESALLLSPFCIPRSLGDQRKEPSGGCLGLCSHRNNKSSLLLRPRSASGTVLSIYCFT